MADVQTTFHFFPQLNQETDVSWVSSRSSLTLPMAERFFMTGSLQDKLVLSIAESQVLPIKEVLECFEFVSRVRKVVRTDCVADLCCGHGLVGILLGVFERRVERVRLVDKVQPPSHELLLEAVGKIAPWLPGKVTFEQTKLNSLELPERTSIVSAHACGGLTDECIRLGMEAKSNIAVMPCCYPRRNCKAPTALLKEFGEAVAFDIDRTYRLEGAGYAVKWCYIPKAITPMNRILIGKLSESLP